MIPKGCQYTIPWCWYICIKVLTSAASPSKYGVNCMIPIVSGCWFQLAKLGWRTIFWSLQGFCDVSLSYCIGNGRFFMVLPLPMGKNDWDRQTKNLRHFWRILNNHEAWPHLCTSPIWMWFIQSASHFRSHISTRPCCQLPIPDLRLTEPEGYKVGP